MEGLGTQRRRAGRWLKAWPEGHGAIIPGSAEGVSTMNPTMNPTMNRRRFLYGSAAASAAAMSARSYGRILGANDRVGVGVIGLGRRGTIVSAALLEDKRAHVVAVCD